MNWNTPVTPVQALTFLYLFALIVILVGLRGILARDRNKPHDSASHSD